METLSIDFETRSVVDLKSTGVYPYAQHPLTDVICMAWAFGEEEPQLWWPGEPLPARIRSHILDKGEIRAWNAQFERVIWHHVMYERYGITPVLNHQWVCTAAEAAAMALPRSLDEAARVLGVAQQKDKQGYNLMMRMSRPRSIVDGKPVWWTDSEKLERLGAYCIQDVRTERSAAKALRRLNPLERRIYLLDQRINDRGVSIDTALIQSAREVAEEGRRRADVQLEHVTAGEVLSVTDHKALTAWVREQGVITEGVSKPAIQEMLAGELPISVRFALQLRSDAGRTSVAKLESMIDWLSKSPSPRMRGMYLYHAASTGRWAGRGPQPHNLPRGTVKNIMNYTELVRGGNYDTIDLVDHPITLVSSMLRNMLVAAPGKTLVAGDYSAVEARVLNWLAGQEDVLERFRAYDAGDKSQDPYVVMARIMGTNDRQAGKAAELGCGFQMGAKKFVSAAWKVYQVSLTEGEAKHAVDAYRQSHPHVVSLWWTTEDAVLKAVQRPGEVQRFGALKNLKAIVAGAYLYIVLPSGRALAYAAPRVVDAETPWGTLKPQLEYSGVDSFTKKWGRLRAYGGFLVENIVQAVARDLLAEAMLRVEVAGYPVVMHTHDELVAEVPEGMVSDAKVFHSLMAELPEWAKGCPINVEGWMGERYRK